MVSLHERDLPRMPSCLPQSQSEQLPCEKHSHKKPYPFGLRREGGRWRMLTLLISDSAEIRNSPTLRKKLPGLCATFLPALPPVRFTVLPPTPSARPSLVCASESGAMERGDMANYKLRWQDFPDDWGWTSVTKLMSHRNQKS